VEVSVHGQGVSTVRLRAGPANDVQRLVQMGPHHAIWEFDLDDMPKQKALEAKCFVCVTNVLGVSKQIFNCLCLQSGSVKFPATWKEPKTKPPQDVFRLPVPGLSQQSFSQGSQANGKSSRKLLKKKSDKKKNKKKKDDDDDDDEDDDDDDEEDSVEKDDGDVQVGGDGGGNDARGDVPDEKKDVEDATSGEDTPRKKVID
jgi:hypothetical protein